MVILGPCPHCGMEGSLFVKDGEVAAICSNLDCGHVWSDWCTAVEKSGQNSARLIPVSVRRMKASAFLELPTFVPCEGFVTEVLRTALAFRFGLHKCENKGVQGLVRMNGAVHSVKFFGREDMLGMGDNKLFHDNEASQIVLSWYAKELEILFQDELLVRGVRFGRGAILRLTEQDPAYEEKCKLLVWLALQRRSGGRFAREVFRRARVEVNGFKVLTVKDAVNMVTA